MSDVDEVENGDNNEGGENGEKKSRKRGKSFRRRRTTTRISINGINMKDLDEKNVGFEDDQEGLSDLEPEQVLDKVAKKALSSCRAVELLRACFEDDSSDESRLNSQDSSGRNSNASGNDAPTRNFGLSDCVRASLMSLRRNSLDGLEEFARRRSSTVQKLGVYYKNCECQTDVTELAPCFGYAEQECQTPKWWAVLDRANKKRDLDDPLRHSCTIGDLDSNVARDSTDLGAESMHMFPGANSDFSDQDRHADGDGHQRQRRGSTYATTDMECQTEIETISDNSIEILNRLQKEK